MILPLLLAFPAVVCASIAVRRELERGYRLEAGGAGAEQCTTNGSGHGRLLAPANGVR